MNSTLSNVWRVLALAVGVLVLAGTAAADNGGGNGNGNPPATPPGQEKKAEATPPAAPAPAAAPAASSAPGQVKKATKAEPAKAAAPAAKEKPAKPSKSKAKAKAKPSSSSSHSSNSNSSSAAAPKVTICHATGSATNPYVEITIAKAGWDNGHSKHDGDLNPVPAGGCPESAPAGSQQHGNDKEKDDKVTICHATGSATNPYVVITIAQAGWDNGHSKHEGDINPAPAAGCPATPPAGLAASEVKTESTCPSETRTERVLVGIKHYTGSDSNPYVVISPSEASAHLEKHDRDEAIYETRVITTSTGAVCSSTLTSTVLTTTAACPQTETRTERVLVGIKHYTGSDSNPYVVISPSEASAHLEKHDRDEAIYELQTIVVSTGQTCATSVTTTPAGVAGTAANVTTVTPAATAGTAATTAGTAPTADTASQPASAGGIAGVNATLPKAKKKDRGGVLGTTRTLGETAIRGRLPFTGLPLWTVVLAGGALIAAGLVLRRRRLGYDQA